MRSLSTFLMVVIAGLFYLSLANPLKAETTGADHHQHSHNAPAKTELGLDQGKKWKTDVPLRQGMQKISEAAMNAAPSFHDNKLTQGDAEKLAKQINEQINYLLVNCKLEPQADATLHLLIGELLQGVDNLSKQPLSTEGLPQILKVLQKYPNYFDHSGWMHEGEVGLDSHH